MFSLATLNKCYIYFFKPEPFIKNCLRFYIIFNTINFREKMNIIIKNKES